MTRGGKGQNGVVAFDRTKTIIASGEILTHNDLKLPLKLYQTQTRKGQLLSRVLSQVMDGRKDFQGEVSTQQAQEGTIG